MAIYRRRFTVLGCASSPGVPRINGDWGACDPQNPRNRRTRAAFMVEQIGPDGGKTTVVIDTGPDFREQMIAAKVQAVDAVLYTHAHADHLHGIDDLRIYFALQKSRIPIWADPVTMARIRDGFAYCLETPAGSNYPPIVRPQLIADINDPVIIDGAGGPIPFKVHMQQHGDVHSLGFRIGDVAYCTDVSDFPAESLPKLACRGSGAEGRRHRSRILHGTCDGRIDGAGPGCGNGGRYRGGGKTCAAFLDAFGTHHRGAGL